MGREWPWATETATGAMAGSRAGQNGLARAAAAVRAAATRAMRVVARAREAAARAARAAAARAAAKARVAAEAAEGGSTPAAAGAPAPAPTAVAAAGALPNLDLARAAFLVDADAMRAGITQRVPGGVVYAGGGSLGWWDA